MPKFLVIIILGLIVIGSFVGYQFYTVRQNGALASEAQQATFSFINHISKNEIDDAYNMTSSVFKASATREKFTQFTDSLRADGLSTLDAQRVIGFNVNLNAGKPTLYTFRSEIRNTEGKTAPVVTTLVKEDDQLKIYNIVINPK